MRCRVELLCLGNELLNGKVLNTNAQWLGQEITALAAEIDRMTVVGDDEETISLLLQETIRRKPDHIITTGGLGPTFDDKTLASIAKALKVHLAMNQEALEMLREKYADRFPKQHVDVLLTPARLKMATLPEGFRPLRNPAGFAPGAIGTADGVTVISLPGIPDEMKAIFKDSVEPLIRSQAGAETYRESNLLATGIYESDLAPLIDETMKAYPAVYIKSRPIAGRRPSQIRLHLSIISAGQAEAAREIKLCETYLKSLILSCGGAITDETCDASRDSKA